MSFSQNHSCFTTITDYLLHDALTETSYFAIWGIDLLPALCVEFKFSNRSEHNRQIPTRTHIFRQISNSPTGTKFARTKSLRNNSWLAGKKENGFLLMTCHSDWSGNAFISIYYFSSQSHHFVTRAWLRYVRVFAIANSSVVCRL